MLIKFIHIYYNSSKGAVHVKLSVRLSCDLLLTINCHFIYFLFFIIYFGSLDISK